MDSQCFLQQNLERDSLEYFGACNIEEMTHLAAIWHDDSKNLNGRWKEIEDFDDHKGKILDMACGVGTFLFYGLNKGYDVYGIEPEQWKLLYMDKKIKERGYPLDYKKRILEGVGEDLPFKDNFFDYITTYQTLEHVQNIDKTIDELIRVLSVGGKLRIQAPDYNSCYEPHYCLPFLPKMNRQLAKLYLRILKKPTKGLNTLNWTTSKYLIKYLGKFPNIKVVDLEALYFQRYLTKKTGKLFLPAFLSNFVWRLIYYKYILSFNREKQIRLVVWKLATSDNAK
jgi:ubiquinone/menaquinone biosynthesis C-methylase UbiE